MQQEMLLGRTISLGGTSGSWIIRIVDSTGANGSSADQMSSDQVDHQGSSGLLTGAKWIIWNWWIIWVKWTYQVLMDHLDQGNLASVQ
jgi:hypothetical protein